MRVRNNKNKPHQHKWSRWLVDFVIMNLTIHKIRYRDCKCGALQRHDITTGEITIWESDGVNSGLLDRGITRQTYEELDGPW